MILTPQPNEKKSIRVCQNVTNWPQMVRKVEKCWFVGDKYFFVPEFYEKGGLEVPFSIVLFNLKINFDKTDTVRISPTFNFLFF